MLHLVIGNTGPVGLGREICRLLSSSGQAVRALVRPTSDPERVAELKAMDGVELIEADLKDRASLDRACQGVSAVLTSATTTLCRQPDDTIEAVDRDGYVNLVEAAKAAEVAHFVYTSYSKNTQAYAECPLTDSKKRIEKLVTDSGMAYTILRPSYFTECWIGPNLHFDITEHKALIYGDGNTKISWISTIDVAKFAVAALDNPAARNAVLELGGNHPLSPLEVVAECETIGGCKFDVEHVSVENLERERSEATDSLGVSMAALKLGYAGGDFIPMDEVLQKFPEIELRSVHDYMNTMLGS